MFSSISEILSCRGMRLYWTELQLFGVLWTRSDGAVQILWKGKDGGGTSRSQQLSVCRTGMEWENFYESTVISPDRLDNNRSPGVWLSGTEKSPNKSELQQHLQNKWGSSSSGPEVFRLQTRLVLEGPSFTSQFQPPKWWDGFWFHINSLLPLHFSIYINIFGFIESCGRTAVYD